MQDFSEKMCQNLKKGIRKLVEELTLTMSESAEPTKRQEIASQIDTCTWELLEPHVDKAQIFLIGQELEFLEVALAIYENNVEFVDELITSEQIIRPTPEKIIMWQEIPEKQFRMIVLRPFLLIQEVMAS
jgi:hypothetical protein